MARWSVTSKAVVAALTALWGGLLASITSPCTAIANPDHPTPAAPTRPRY
jgi:hypothetical protein